MEEQLAELAHSVGLRNGPGPNRPIGRRGWLPLNSQLAIRNFPCRYFFPIAKRLDMPRTYNTPSEIAGVAISSSPIE